MEEIVRWIRACGNCGTTVGPVDGFCSECFERVLNLSSSFVVGGHPFPVRSLLVWNENQEIVGNLVRSLKGPWSRFGYSILGYEVSVRANLKNQIVVVPPAKGRKEDHAWNFGFALADFCNCELISPFQVDSTVEQKSLNKVERAALSFKLNQRVRGESFVFVDDLITTGATARAAWKALGKPRDFIAWTLAYRPLKHAPTNQDHSCEHLRNQL